MSSTITFDRTEVPPAEIGYLKPPTRHGRDRSPGYALRWAYLPVIISVAVNAIFFVVYWVPEFGSFPGHDAVLTQLSPLASPELTTQGEPVVAVQQGRPGLIPTFLLLASPIIPLLARHRRWQARLIIPIVLCYLAAIGWMVTMLSALARGVFGETAVGLLLMTGWVAAAFTTVWRSFWVSPDGLPGRPTRVLWLVGLFALLYPLPVAVGRRIFAPELRQAAVDLLGGDVQLRTAALITPEVFAVYLAGVTIVLVAWAWYMVIPPMQPLRTRWLRRGAKTAADPLGVRLLILAGCAVTLALTGAGASYAGTERAAQISSGSPASDLVRACESWVAQPADQPAQTLTLSGPSCQQVDTFDGYRRAGSTRLDVRLSPVWAYTAVGDRIHGRTVSAQFGSVVVAASSSRFDLQPDQLQGIRITDANVLWTFRCDDDQAMRLRFAAADGGDDPARGRSTEFAEKPSVVAICSNDTASINPANGRRLET